MLTVAGPAFSDPPVPPELAEARQLLAGAMNKLMVSLGKVAARGSTVEVVTGLTDALRMSEAATAHAEKAQAALDRAATYADAR